MTQPAIRRASSADAERLAALGARTFRETFGHLYPIDDLEPFLAEVYAVARTRAELARPDTAAWLAEAAGEAVGYAVAGPCGLPHRDASPPAGELKRLYVLQPWQAGGLGGRLFACALAWLQSAGPRDVFIGVWSENSGAQRFYGRHGFRQVGEYGFPVGRTVDREFILHRSAADFARNGDPQARLPHDSSNSSRR